MKKQKWEKEFEEKVEILHNDLVFGDYSYTKSFIRQLLAQQKEENFWEGEKNMAGGVLRRIEKGKSLEHIKVLCEAILLEKL